MVAILMISVKLATLGLLELKVSSNKCYDVIILSRDSDYIVDVVLWSKFGNFSFSMREVIITSIL